MGVEIERKFLVLNKNYKNLVSPVHCIQGYIMNIPLTRIRIINNTYSYITNPEYILSTKNLLDGDTYGYILYIIY